MLGCWGLLPIAAPAAAFVALRLGSAAFPGGRASDRVLAGAALFGVATVGVVQGLGAAGRLDRLDLAAALLAATLGVSTVPRPAPPPGFPGPLVTRATSLVVASAIAALAASVLAAYWLPVWQWDALGYHLPYVSFVLAAHGTGGVPADMPYVSSYPHVVESFVVALRAMLPDDRLVDLAQIPFGLLGAAATAGIARRCGAPRPEAIAAGAAWIAVPAVFLQMPTDYVDVGSAAWLLVAIYFVLSASDRAPGDTACRPLLVGAIALGLFLGSKPSTPVAAAIVLALVAAVARRAGEGRIAVAAASIVAVVGGGAFAVNALRHGNPVWPVEVRLGPWRLPGQKTMQYLLESGAASPRLRGPTAWRVLRSWTSLASPPAFDMRIGGLGPLFLAALPAAAVTLARARPPSRVGPLACGALVAAVATPDPAVARYVLAFPALVFALAAPRAAGLARPAALWAGAVAGLVALGQVAYAWPGLSGEGPPLLSYARMSDAERAEAVGADGPPTRIVEARGRLSPGEAFAFDETMELPYLAWDAHLTGRVVWLSSALDPDRIGEYLAREDVRVVVAGDALPAGRWLSQRPDRYLRLFHCKSAPCSVYERR